MLEVGCSKEPTPDAARASKTSPDAGARSARITDAQSKYITIETVVVSGAVDVLALPGRVTIRPQAQSAVGATAAGRIVAVLVQPGQAVLKRSERERWPVPVLSVGRTWTDEPYGAANFVGLSTEIPLSDAWRGLMAKSAADLRAAQSRREAIEFEADVELRRLIDALAQRRAALERFRRNVGERIPALKQMAEDAYQLGRASLLELIDAARSRLDARITDVDLRAATVGQEVRILGLTGKLGG